jgi:hypothetical protein
VANHLKKLKLKLWDSGFFGNENWTGGFGFKPPALHLDFWAMFGGFCANEKGRVGVQSPGLPSDMPGPATSNR